MRRRRCELAGIRCLERLNSEAVELRERGVDDLPSVDGERARMSVRAFTKRARTARRIVGQHAMPLTIERRPAVRIAAGCNHYTWRLHCRRDMREACVVADDQPGARDERRERTQR